MARTIERGDARSLGSSSRPAWRKAPTRLLRRPVLFAALAAASLLVALTVATFPLFLSAAQSELLTATLNDPSYTRYGAGITYRVNDVSYGAADPNGSSLLAERAGAFAKETARSPELDPAIEGLAGTGVSVTGPDGEDPASGPVSGRLFFGDDDLAHVRVISGTEGDGVWLPDYIADPLHLGPGDRVMLHDGGDTVLVPIDGIYAAIFKAPRDGYWQPWSEDIYQFPSGCVDCSVPPPFILADRTQLLDLQAKLHDLQVDQALVAPVRATPPPTIEEVQTLGRFADALEGRMQTHTGSLGSLFACCGRFQVSTSGFGPVDTIYRSAIGGVVRVADQRATEVRGPAYVLLVAGLAIAFAAIAAAAVFAYASRPDEAGVLRVRGWGPAGVGARAALESVLPVLAGACMGAVLAFVLVGAFGPNGRIGAQARRAAVVGTVLAALAAIVLVACVTAASYAASHEHRSRVSRMLTWVPWEALAFAAALVWGRALRTGGGVSEVGPVREPRPAVFLYPLALALGIGILGARIIAMGVARRARADGTGRVSAGWLATRRFSASSRLGVAFVVAATLAVAVFVSAQGLVGSLRTTVDAKAKTFVGSDVSVQIVPGGSGPTRFPFPLTVVQRALAAGTFDEDTSHFDLLVVDPSSFASAAFWDDALSPESLPDLMARLDRTDGRAVPVILANAGDRVPATITLNTTEAPVEVVGRAVSFPGAASHAPIVVMSRDALAATFHLQPYRVSSSNSNTELWIRGPTADVVDAVTADPEIDVFLMITADQVRDVPLIQAAVNTFLVLDILGLVALLLIVVLAVVYLQARQRSRVVASTLSARMGMSARVARASLVLELGGALLIAVGLGALAALVATPVVVASLDPIPSIPPPPFTVLPWVAIPVAGLLLILAACVGGWLADRAARRGSLGEVMRVAGW